MCVTNNSLSRRRPVVSLTPNLVSPDTLVSSQCQFEDGSFDSASFESTNVSKNGELSDAACEAYSSSDDNAEKAKSKYRRKPRKAGKTAKMNDRHFVVHNYHDHAADPEEKDAAERGRTTASFPMKLHHILDLVEEDGLDHVVSWQPHGRCFKVHKPKEFVAFVMPKYFRQTKMTSFQRQLNLYGFSRLTTGLDASGYYHELFLRGKPGLCKKMIRTKVKGTKFKAASSPDQEPNFYAMPPVSVAPRNDSSMQPDNEFTESIPVLSFEAIPMTVNSQQQAPFMEQMKAPNSIFPYTAQKASVCTGDSVLDEAVNEIFFEGLDDLRAWNLSSTFEDDACLGDGKLGSLLERLMED